MDATFTGNIRKKPPEISRPLLAQSTHFIDRIDSQRVGGCACARASARMCRWAQPELSQVKDGEYQSSPAASPVSNDALSLSQVGRRDTTALIFPLCTKVQACLVARWVNFW